MTKLSFNSALEASVATFAYRQIAILLLEGALKGHIEFTEIKSGAEDYIKGFIGENISYGEEADVIGAGLTAIEEFFSKVTFEGPSEEN
ncbi:hypothetical protein O8B93_22155 [Agrobacterium rhizogenes]|uniref:hypothetical protein n=1 Tax=Rhizobium rhizogenes TaxID=359 RepID=UPI0022B6FCA0|nr:hypothetical protein [Rhizobium rhizogenes]MCZ7450291.1 hypothetical protein [Rhizobium rhizogenes]